MANLQPNSGGMLLHPEKLILYPMELFEPGEFPAMQVEWKEEITRKRKDMTAPRYGEEASLL